VYLLVVFYGTDVFQWYFMEVAIFRWTEPIFPQWKPIKDPAAFGLHPVGEDNRSGPAQACLIFESTVSMETE